MVAFGWIPMRRKHLRHHGWEPCKLLGKPCRLVDVCGAGCWEQLLVRSWGDPETLPRQAPSLDLSLDTQLQAGITSTSLPNFFTGFSWKGCISVKSGGYWKHWVPVFYINLVWHLGRPQKAVSLLNWEYQTSVEHVAKGVKTRFRWFNSKVLIKSAMSTLMRVVMSGSLVLWLVWHWRLEPFSAN